MAPSKTNRANMLGNSLILSNVAAVVQAVLGVLPHRRHDQDYR